MRRALVRLWREPTALVALAVALAVALLVLWPVWRMLSESLRSPEGWTLARYARVASSSYFRHTLYNTLLVSAIATLLSLALGLAYAYLVVCTPAPLKWLFSATVVIPMILPAFLVAFSLILLLGRNGLINQALFRLGELLNLANPARLQWVIFGSRGVILAQTLTFFPMAFLLYSAALLAIDSRLEEAAYDLGARYHTVIWRVVLPLLAPATLSASLLIFMFNASAFGAPALLGGGRLFFRNATMLAPEAIIQILGLGDWGMGATLAVVLVIPSLLLYALSEAYLKRRNFVTVGSRSGTRNLRVPPAVTWGLFALCSLVSLFILTIVAVIVLGAFTRTWGVNYSLSWRHMATALAASSRSVTNSLLTSLLGALLAAGLGVGLAYFLERKSPPGSRLLDLAATLPYALPGVVMGLGFAIAFNRPILGVALAGSGAIIVLNHTVRRLPFALRGGVAALKQIDVQLEEAAADLGAAPLQVLWHVTLPLLRPTFLGAFAFGFINMMTDITAVIFLVSPRWRLLSIDLFNAIDAGRLGVAAALAVVMMAVTFAALGAAYLLSGGRVSPLGQREA